MTMFMFCVDEVGCNSAVVCLFNVNYQINVDDKFQNALHREIGKKTSHNSAVVSKKVMFDAYIKADEPILTSVFFQIGSSSTRWRSTPIVFLPEIFGLGIFNV